MVKHIFIILIISLIKVSNNTPIDIKNSKQDFCSVSIDTVKINYNNLLSEGSTLNNFKPSLINRHIKKESSIQLHKKDKDILKLVEYIKEHEGFRSTAYQCLGSKLKSKKFYTIGYGHVIKKKERYLINKKITEQEALDLVYKDLEECYLLIINDSNLPIEQMTKNQKLSLSHFIYALGIGTFKKSSLYKEICSSKTLDIDKDLFTRYCRIIKGNGKSIYLKNLYKTREYEYNLFTKK